MQQDAFRQAALDVIAQPPASSPWLAERTYYVRMVLTFSLIAIVIAAVTFGVLGGLQPQNNAHYDQSRDQVAELRLRYDQLAEQYANATANQTAELESVGFSVTKATTQTGNSGVFIFLTGWATDSGAGQPPGYDNTNGGLDNSTGFFTASVAGTYRTSASICWEPGAAGSYIGVLINTVNGLMNTFGHIYYGGTGSVCNQLTTVYAMQPGDAIGLLAVQTSGAAQTVTNSTTIWSAERIAAYP